MKSPRLSPLAAALALIPLASGPFAVSQDAPLPGPRLLPPGAEIAPPTAPTVEAPPPESVQTDISEIDLDAVVRVDVDTKQPNFRVPWNVGGMTSGNGTGFLVGPNRFLTNAHVVSDSRLIYLKNVSDPEPYKARVVNVAHDCDLALLELESPEEFAQGFAGIRPLKIGDIPKLNTTVIAVGYPIGGDRISVTRGVVSRIDFRGYSHSGVDNHLAIQIDAAINPGNSGGPVLQDNKVVGVAFQGYSGDVAQNTSYMIPVPVIERFLKDVEDGTYDRYVDLATSFLTLLNPAQRRALKLPDDGIGVMVAKADAAGSAGGVLKTRDVLLSIEGHPIASDGFIEIEGERVDLNEIIERKFSGDKVVVELLRDGEKKEVEVTLKRFIPYLIQAAQYDQQPNFVLFAGLQFQPLDRSVMAAHNISDLRTRYFYGFYGDHELYRERPQVIVLTEVLPDATNTHLQGYKHLVVDSINGRKIRLLQDVYDTLYGEASEDGKEDFHVIRLVGEERPLVLKRADSKLAHERIMAQYNVSFDHFIEEPEILELGDLIEEQPDAKPKEGEAAPTQNEKTEKSGDQPAATPAARDKAA